MNENKTEKLLKIISKLRDPSSGCEWTKSQTSKSLLPFILEETKEIQEAFENNDYENFYLHENYLLGQFPEPKKSIINKFKKVELKKKKR